MKFQALAIQDAKLLELKVQKDERGFFVRTFCKETLQQEHIAYTCEQSSISVTQKTGTLRGLHFQRTPHIEGKFVRCVRGRIYDVIVDLRNESSTYGKWLAIELIADEYKMLYVPKGCAHGFVTLEDNCEVSYIMDEPYDPKCASGILWNSPILNISWPITHLSISEQDKTWPAFEIGEHYL